MPNCNLCGLNYDEFFPATLYILWLPNFSFSFHFLLYSFSQESSYLLRGQTTTTTASTLVARRCFCIAASCCVLRACVLCVCGCCVCADCEAIRGGRCTTTTSISLKRLLPFFSLQIVLHGIGLGRGGTCAMCQGGNYTLPCIHKEKLTDVSRCLVFMD
jgi:hypothetical protein